MFVMNGIVYGGDPINPLKVNDFKIVQDRIMLITFSNGETRLFDATILNKGVFEKLDNNDAFNSARLEHGVVIWLNGEIDCAPEFMYKNSYEYPTLDVV